MMTKREWLEFLSEYEDGQEISDYDVNEFLRCKEEAHKQWIEDLEEEQHKSGFYEFQDRLEMYRRER